MLLATTADLLRVAVMEWMRPTPIRGSGRLYDREGIGMMTSEWIRELRMAGRSLMRAPGFLVASVGTLALALGVNAAMFTVVDEVLVDPLPYPESERLVHIAASAPGSDFPDEFPVGMEFYLQYRERADQLESVAVYSTFTATLRAGDRVERVRMAEASPSLFQVLGEAPLLGRLPREDDGDRVAVLSHAAWVDWFGAAPGVVGRTHYMFDSPKTVIGVMPPDFHFPNDGTLLWIPRAVESGTVEPGEFEMELVGRMAPGADHASLADQLAPLARRLPERFGGTASYARLMERHVPVVRSLKDHMFGEIAGAVGILAAAAAVVLLIACVNVAGLFFVRFESRGRDLAVRRALGAGRGKLLRGLMAEGILVAGLAGVVAVALAWAGAPAFLRAAPDSLGPLVRADTSGTTVTLTLVATLLVALLSGFVPGLRASRPRLDRLRDGSRGSTGGKRWGRDGLVVLQTALALVLLIGSGLLLRSFAELRGVDPGYDTQDLFTFQFAPEQEHLSDGPSWARFHLTFLDRLEALPGVESAGIVNNVPLDEGLRQVRLVPEEAAGDDDAVLFSYTMAGGGYFETMGVEVLRGRGFGERDLEGSPVVVLSESAADRLWPGGNPVGRRLRAVGGSTHYTVVGVVEDVLQYDFRDRGEIMVYLPMVGPTPDAWVLSSPGYVVRTARAEVIAPEIRALVREVAPEAPMYRSYTMASLAERSMAGLSFTMLTLAGAAALALILGAVGLYGTLSYAVSRRTREIGVRMALGAGGRQVRRMIVVQGGRVVAAGVGLGALVAVAGTRLLGTLLFGVEALDPVVFAGMSAVMVLVGLLASYLPAHRASSVAPVESMRQG